MDASADVADLFHAVYPRLVVLLYATSGDQADAEERDEQAKREGEGGRSEAQHAPQLRGAVGEAPPSRPPEPADPGRAIGYPRGHGVPPPARVSELCRARRLEREQPE